MTELNALKRELSNDQLASFYAEQFFSGIATNSKAESDFTSILQKGIQRYANVEAIKSATGESDDINSKIRAIFNLFPSFGFLLCNEMDQSPDYYEFTNYLRLSVSLSSITRKINVEKNTELVISQIDPEQDLDLLEEKIGQINQDTSYLPKALNEGFQRLIQTLPNLKSTTDPQHLIEINFYFTAIKQVFLKKYFYLMGSSPNDIVAAHFNRVFSRLLLSIRTQEIRYWKKYKNGKKLQSQIVRTIQLDNPKTRHPQLRKHVFELINRFNPVIQDGSVKTTVIEVRQLLAKQLALFHGMSVNKLVLLLDLVQKTEGTPYVTYFLTQLNRTDIQKLSLLYEHVKNLSADKTKALQQLIVAYAAKLPKARRKLLETKAKGADRVETVYKTIDGSRKAHATKRLKETKGKRGMTHEQVPKFLEERLKKLFEKAKIEGALTQDQIPEYLAKFAEAAEAVVGPIPIGSQTEIIEEFKATTDEILEEITGGGGLTDQEIEVVRAEIKEKTDALDTPDVEERTDIVDEIGVTLTEASIESDKRQEAEDMQGFFAKNIIPYGLDKKAKRITIGDFFSFPFGDFNGPNEDDWFDYHMRYLQLAVKENKLDKSNFVKIFNSLSHLPKIKYKKYFNIFPNDQFEETTFMAVYDLWQNKAFDRLRIH